MIEITFHGGDSESGNVFAVRTDAEAGYELESHQHEHSHLSILAEGVADVTVDGVTTRMTGPTQVTIPANTKHKVQAVTNVVWFCLWADHLAPKEQAQDSLKLIKGN